MLYLFTFLSLFITATLATKTITSYEKDVSITNHPLTKFHRELQSSSKRPISSSEERNIFVLANSFTNNDCNSDDGKLYDSMAILSGSCLVSGSTAQRWTCDSSTVHIEEFNDGDCDESHRYVDSYINVGQCFATHTTASDYAVSYGCSSSYAPKGSWYTVMYFSDNACQHPIHGLSILNGYCVSSTHTSYKYNYPKEHYYFSSGDCTGAVTTYDISSSTNVCRPISVGSYNSYEHSFVQN